MITAHLVALILDWRTWLAMAILMVAPPFALRAMALVYSRDDPRRAEMIAELHVVPFLRRPLWVLQQVEFVVWEGLPDRFYMLAAGRIVERWKLGNGEESHRRYPATFYLPSAEERHQVLPGDVVKLMFEMRDGWGERMWVTVQRTRRKGYVGTLSNTSIGIPRLEYGAKVKFGPQHIIDIDAGGSLSGPCACTPEAITDCDRIEPRRCAECGESIDKLR